MKYEYWTCIVCQEKIVTKEQSIEIQILSEHLNLKHPKEYEEMLQAKEIYNMKLSGLNDEYAKGWLGFWIKHIERPERPSRWTCPFCGKEMNDVDRAWHRRGNKCHQ